MTGLCFGQQRPVLYTGINYFRNVSYEHNFYSNFHVGAQLYKYKIIAPEIGINYYYGNLRDSYAPNNQDEQARSPRVADGRFSQLVFSISPKLLFGDESAALVILPQYNFGKINAKGNFLIDNGKNYVLQKEIKNQEKTSYWSFAAGVQGDFFDLEMFSFSFMINYSLLNTKEAIGNIEAPAEYPNLNKGSTQGIGIIARVYIDFYQLWRKD